MSAKSNRSDYIILVVLGLASIVVVAAAAGLGLFRESPDQAPPIRTTYSTNPEGAMAFRMLMDQLSMPLQRMRQPISSSTLETIDVLFIVDAVHDLKEKELACLESWIARGGVLVYSGDLGLTEHIEATGDLVPSGFRRPGNNTGDRAETTTVPPDAASMPLARDVSSVVVDSHDTLLSMYSEGSADDSAVALFRDSAGIRVATRKCGLGRTIVLSDSSFMSNSLLNRADNCVLAANLVAYAVHNARGTRVAYDEYHLGYGARPTSWSTLLAAICRSSLGWSVLVLAGAGVLYVIYKGRRFGTRRAPARTRWRSKLEYVYSVGATYRAAGAHRLTLRLIFNWFKSRCGSLVGLPPTSSPDKIAARLVVRTGKPKGTYEDILRACEQTLAESKVSGRRLTSLLHRMAEMESEIFDGK